MRTFQPNSKYVISSSVFWKKTKQNTLLTLQPILKIGCRKNFVIEYLFVRLHSKIVNSREDKTTIRKSHGSKNYLVLALYTEIWGAKDALWSQFFETRCCLEHHIYYITIEISIVSCWISLTYFGFIELDIFLTRILGLWLFNCGSKSQ